MGGWEDEWCVLHFEFCYHDCNEEDRFVDNSNYIYYFFSGGFVKKIKTGLKLGFLFCFFFLKCLRGKDVFNIYSI